MLGLGCGFLVLLIPYRRHFVTARFLVPLGVVLAGLFVVVARRSAFFEQVLTSRLSTEGRGSSTHFLVYDFIPDVLAQHPLFGLGLNTFSVYYEFQTGKTNFGPHSFYVASFVETGLVGNARVRRVPRLPLPPLGGDQAHRSRARGDRRPARRARVAARMGPHRCDRRLDGVERLLPRPCPSTTSTSSPCSRSPLRRCSPGASTRREGPRPDDVVPARRGRRRRDVRPRRGRRPARGRGSRFASCRRRASVTTGSPTGTGS